MVSSARRRTGCSGCARSGGGRHSLHARGPRHSRSPEPRPADGCPALPRGMMPTRIRLAVVIAQAVAWVTLTALPARSQTGNPIVVENQQPGAGEWQIPNSGYQFADDYTNQIKGYASAVSANKGGSLSFLVTVSPAQTFTIAFYRMGWYGGLGGRLMLRTAPISGVQQPACPTVDTQTLLIVCDWTPSYALTVPASWTGGIYLAVLSNAQGYQNY